MKYKLIDGSTIYLAGVASYTAGDSAKAAKAPKKPKKVKINLDFDFDNPKTFVFDFDKMKEEKEKFKEGIKKEARKFKEASEKSKASSDSNSNSNSDSTNDTSRNNGFEFAEDFMSGFGEAMNDLGKNLEQWGKSFEGSMEKFGVNLDKFGSEMDKFGSEIEKRVSNYTKEMEKHWCNDVSSDDYDTWELESLFNEIYQNNSSIKEFDKSPNLYYKVDAYDLGTAMNDQLTFVGAHLNLDSPVPFAFVTKKLIADKWLVLKLSKEEYSKDWMQKLDTIDQLADYEIEQYLITRQFKDSEEQENKKIKIYLPLKNK